MSEINIQEYLSCTEKEEEKKTRNYSYPEYTYEKLFDNGMDLIIKRTSRTGIEREMVIVPSKSLFYIRDTKKGIDTPVTAASQVKRFFDMRHSDWDDMQKGFKNAFYRHSYVDNFAENVVKWFDNPLARILLAKGKNPKMYIDYYESAPYTNFIRYHIENHFSAFQKISTFLEENRDNIKETSSHCMETIFRELLAHSLYIASEINLNNAMYFLKKAMESNTIFDLPAYRYRDCGGNNTLIQPKRNCRYD